MVKRSSNERKFNLYSPKEIKAHMDKYVIGQEEAKKVLSVAVYNHYKRLLANRGIIATSQGDFDDVKIEKSNIILLGGTGSGKTFMIQTIAKMLGVPLFVQDCTKLTESGYVGEDVENCVGGLLRACDFDIEEAQRGIVVLDEVDKLAKTGKANMSITRDVGGEGVQQGLLKIVEGSVVGVPPQGGRKHPEQQLCYVDTSNILFIALGAFPGIEDHVGSRFNKSSVGFKNSTTNADLQQLESNKVLDMVTSDDLKNFGLIPEFIGRFPVITHTNPLSVESLAKILSEPKNSLLKQYQKLLSIDKVDLKFTDSAINVIANIAFKSETGARGLRGVMEKILLDVMFDYAETGKGKKITVDEKFVKDILVRKGLLTVAN